MAKGRPLKPLNLSDEVRAQLESIARSRSMSHALVRRAKIVSMSDQGRTNQQIEKQLGLSGACGQVASSFLRTRPDGALR